MSPTFVRLLVSTFVPYVKYVNSWTKTLLSCSFMRLSFQDLITNSLLFGLPDYVINQLQLIQNSAARLVFCARKHDHVTPLLINLHWLKIQYRIQFKILLMTFKVLCGEAPSYLCDLITPYVPTRRTNYSYTCLVSILRVTDSVRLRHLLHGFGMICLVTLKTGKI